MMSDSRAFDGWRRLGAAVCDQVERDDPAGLRQVRDVLDQQRAGFNLAVARLAGAHCPTSCTEHVHYSHGEIARELGVTRQAVSKAIKATL